MSVQAVDIDLSTEIATLAMRERFQENDIAVAHGLIGLVAIIMAMAIVSLAIILFGYPPEMNELSVVETAHAQTVPADQIRPITIAQAPMILAAAESVVPLLSSATETYRVRWGDTLTHIARRFETTVEVIARDNAIKNPDFIRVGLMLSLKKGEGHTSPVQMAKQLVSPEKFTARGGASQEKHLVLPARGKPPIASTRSATVTEKVPSAVVSYDCRTLLVTGRAHAKRIASRDETLDCIEQEYGHFIREAAQASVLPAELITAILYVESKGNPGAVSATGCQGLMQLLKSTAREYQVVLERIFDPRENILGGTRVFSDYLRRYAKGDIAVALAMYNVGTRGLQQERARGLRPIDHPYVIKVSGVLRFIEARKKTRVEPRSPNPA